MKWLQRVNALLRHQQWCIRGRLASSIVGATDGNRVDINSQSITPREFCGTIRQIKSSPMKLNLVAKLIRGMPIADALAQIQFCDKKAADFVEQVLLDTQRKAVEEHEAHPLKLWVAESFVGKGQYQKRIRYHGKGMHGVMEKYYAHYFLKLREGKPPKKKKNIEDTWRYRTRKFIQAGPRSIPNSL